MPLPPLDFGESKSLPPLDFGDQNRLPPLQFNEPSEAPTLGSVAGQFGAGYVGGASAGLIELGEKKVLESTLGKEQAAIELEKKQPKNLPEKIARGTGEVASFLTPWSGPNLAMRLGVKGMQTVAKAAKATKVGQSMLAAAPAAIKTGMVGKSAVAAAEGAAGLVAMEALTLDHDEIFGEPKSAMEIAKELGTSALLGGALGALAPPITKFLGKKIPTIAPKDNVVTGQSAALNEAAGMVSRNIERKGEMKLKNIFQHIATAMTDKFEPIRVMEEMAHAASGSVVTLFTQGAFKGYKAFRMMAGTISKANQFVRENVVPLYREIGKDRHLVDQLMMIESGIEKGNQGVFLKNKTAAEWEAALNEMKASLGQDRFDQITRHSDKVRDLYTRSFNLLVKAGVKSQKEADKILGWNKKYAPWHVVREELENAGKALADGERGAYFLNRKSGTGELDIGNPTDELLNYIYEATFNAERNVAMRRLIGGQGVLANDNRIIKFTPGAKDGALIHAYYNGIKKTFTVQSPEVYEAIKGLNTEQIDTMTRFASFFSRALREGATSFSAPFAVTNVIRDVWNAALTSPIGFTPTDFAYGLWTATTRRLGKVKSIADFRKFINSGSGMSGQFETYGTLKGEELVSSISDKARILSPFNFIREIGMIGEESTRLGLFKRALKMGYPPEEAAFIARNGTIDFNKVGTTLKTMNLWIPFLNARVQGTLNVVNAAKTPGQRARFWTTAGATIGLPAAATMYHNLKEYPDVWNDIRAFDKRDNFLFIYGRNKDEKGRYTDVIRIPKADVGRIFGGITERMMEFAYNEDKRTFYSMGQSLGMEALEAASAVSPVSFAYEGKPSLKGLATGLTPAAIKPIIETFTNTNLYTGKDIIPESEKFAPTNVQYDIATSKLAVGLGQVLPISPYVIDNALQSMFGGAGRTAGSPEKVLEMMTSRFKGAYSGGEYAPMFDALDGARQTVYAPKTDEHRQVEQAFKEYKSIPDSDSAAKHNFLAGQFPGNPSQQKKLFSLVEAEMSGVPGIFRSLENAPGDVRVQWFLDYTENMPDSDRAAWWMWMQYNGFITPQIMEKYYGRQQ